MSAFNNIYQIDNRKVDSWHAENNYWGMVFFSFLGLLFLFLAIGNYKSYIKSDNQINKNHT